MGVIDAYLAEVDRGLRGPRRVKADLLAEARDGLVDAAQAHETGGLDTQAAQRLAVADFGDAKAIAREYQRELGYAQTQRTAVLICLVLAPQDLIWDLTARVFPTHAGPPAPGFAVLEPLLGWLGGLALLCSLLAALACGAGVRYLGVRRRLTRLTGILALAVAGFFGLSGLFLAVLSPTPLLSLGGLPWATAVLILPMVWIAISGRRCLAAA